jgi:glyoxylase-like metal-dependent hydrolase (beta-lactamase superfamily II)
MTAISIQSIQVTPFQQNARVITNKVLGLAAIVDPGGESDRILDSIDLSTTKVEAIILTHSHIDHCAGVVSLLKTLDQKNFKRPGLFAGSESELRQNVEQQALFFGLDPAEYDNCPEPDVLLEPGQRIKLLGTELEARFTPGHSMGHFSFVFPEDEYELIEEGRSSVVKTQVAISGDTLFRGSIGRTDFPGCSSVILLSSIRSQLLTLPDSTIVLPGHGPMTTIGMERRSNPFLQE